MHAMNNEINVAYAEFLWTHRAQFVWMQQLLAQGVVVGIKLRLSLVCSTNYAQKRLCLY